MKTMAAVLERLNEPLRVWELEIPALRSGQVLVEVAYSGVCHTQLLEIRGRRGEDRYLPHTLGHEGSGIVLETAADVTKVRPGDHVVLSWIRGSGREAAGASYSSGARPVNSGAISTFLERAVVAENRVTPIPNEMPLQAAALLGCAVPTGAGIVLNTAQVRPGSSIAVFGVGGIGLSAILMADLMNATTIIAVDVVDEKLDRARRLGATHAINARTEPPVEAIRALTAGCGVDYAVEAVGLPMTMEQAIASVHDQGGLCILAGNLAEGERISVNPFELIRGKRIVGTWGGESNPDRDLPTFMSLYLSGKLRLDALITHRYSLPDVNRAFDDLEAGRVGRALVSLSALL